MRAPTSRDSGSSLPPIDNEACHPKMQLLASSRLAAGLWLPIYCLSNVDPQHLPCCCKCGDASPILLLPPHPRPSCCCAVPKLRCETELLLLLPGSAASYL